MLSLWDYDDEDLGVIQDQPVNGYKSPKITRAQAEIFGTYAHTSMSRRAGDDLFQWACNEAFTS